MQQIADFLVRFSKNRKEFSREVLIEVFLRLKQSIYKLQLQDAIQRAQSERIKRENEDTANTVKTLTAELEATKKQVQEDKKYLEEQEKKIVVLAASNPQMNLELQDTLKSISQAKTIAKAEQAATNGSIVSPSGAQKSGQKETMGVTTSTGALKLGMPPVGERKKIRLHPEVTVKENELIGQLIQELEAEIDARNSVQYNPEFMAKLFEVITKDPEDNQSKHVMLDLLNRQNQILKSRLSQKNIEKQVAPDFIDFHLKLGKFKRIRSTL